MVKPSYIAKGKYQIAMGLWTGYGYTGDEDLDAAHVRPATCSCGAVVNEYLASRRAPGSACVYNRRTIAERQRTERRRLEPSAAPCIKSGRVGSTSLGDAEGAAANGLSVGDLVAGDREADDCEADDRAVDDQATGDGAADDRAESVIIVGG